MLASALPHAEPAPRARPRVSPERVVAVLLGLEIVVFALQGNGFLSAASGLALVRQCAVAGLLAVALTPVIVAGGIDLSVGSLLGLSAVVLGKLWRDGGVPVGLAAVAAILVGVLGGGLNALLVAALRIPALVVTLGTWWLFRGLAEGMTGGYENYTGFPRSFLAVGEGPQVVLLAAVAAGYALFLHRSAAGRGLVAIGFSPEGARHAGIPVGRRLGLVYVLSGAASGLAAVVGVAQVAQAKADAGLGIELTAIAAVVLGGTSISGGRGTVHGTLLGLLAIAVLEHGMLWNFLPAELSRILVGVLLLLAIIASRFGWGKS
jgi:rhamnose transport system permease protein